MNNTAQQPGKKSYTPPKLEVYGDVTRLTQMAPNKGGAGNDGVGNPGTKV